MTGRGREEGDIELGAHASARELRFEKVPETRTRFRGDASQRSHSESRRRNLPEEAQRDVEYRDVGIEWRAAAWVEAREIADDSLSGERPEGGDENQDHGQPGE